MGTRVYVGRLSWDCRERDLERFFKGYGRIREILIKNGFGFVEFDDYKDADDAVYELNGKDLLGERVILEIARGPVRRTGGRFGFRRRGSWLDKRVPLHNPLEGAKFLNSITMQPIFNFNSYGGKPVGVKEFKNSSGNVN
ncbi:Serine-arginine protein 55 [Araneus ventricosus]|uniref:Serine-arginine protein 55 n=1 Tax=Araneus ventricosus TaxID=182803 RepID=A0A4Y2E0X6_ARAVE|nr:Serine-arginine protein 55 [Araneus ventricosus]